jgi:hypothetical protein
MNEIDKLLEVNKIICRLGDYSDMKYHLIFSTTFKDTENYPAIERDEITKKIIEVIDKYDTSLVALNMAPQKKFFYSNEVEFFFDIVIHSWDIFLKQIKNDLRLMLRDLVKREVVFTNVLREMEGTIEVWSDL